ncbi:hypothetical protein [Deinococcus yunweiensis]|uniref:hypothetical protein n=1 Tax=Deinococcus yunweiensis TaxID=367282 RepID=UPI00398EED59
MTKHRGGRGRRAPNKHESFSVSLPPHLKALLDGWVTDDLSRSEVIGQLIEAHAKALAPGRGELVVTTQAVAAPEVAVTSNPQKKLEAPSRPLSEPVKRTPRPSTRAGGVKRTATERLAHSVPVLNIMQRTVPRGLGWKPERYEQTEKLLAQGDSLRADGVNYRTAKGEMIGYKTVEALVRLGVLVE